MIISANRIDSGLGSRTHCEWGARQRWKPSPRNDDRNDTGRRSVAFVRVPLMEFRFGGVDVGYLQPGRAHVDGTQNQPRGSAP
jgi:hypothetical protein